MRRSTTVLWSFTEMEFLKLWSAHLTSCWVTTTICLSELSHLYEKSKQLRLHLSMLGNIIAEHDETRRAPEPVLSPQNKALASYRLQAQRIQKITILSKNPHWSTRMCGCDLGTSNKEINGQYYLRLCLFLAMEYNSMQELTSHFTSHSSYCIEPVIAEVAAVHARRRFMFQMHSFRPGSRPLHQNSFVNLEEKLHNRTGYL